MKMGNKNSRPKTSMIDRSQRYDFGLIWQNIWPSLQAFVIAILPFLAILLTVAFFFFDYRLSGAIAALCLVYLPFAPVVYFVVYGYFLLKVKQEDFFLARFFSAVLAAVFYSFLAITLLLNNVLCTAPDCGAAAIFLFLPPAAVIAYIFTIPLAMGAESVIRRLRLIL